MEQPLVLLIQPAVSSKTIFNYRTTDEIHTTKTNEINVAPWDKYILTQIYSRWYLNLVMPLQEKDIQVGLLFPELGIIRKGPEDEMASIILSLYNKTPLGIQFW